MNVNDRVRKHRTELQGQHRCRLEVCIDMTLIGQVRHIARSKNKPMWSAVQDALEDYVTVHGPLDPQEEPASLQPDREQETFEQSTGQYVPEREESWRLEEHSKLTAEQQRLNDERARLMGQTDSPAWRVQVEE